MSRPIGLLSLVFTVGLGTTGCTVPVAGGLDEPEANRIVVALDTAHVGAMKEADPTVEAKYRVVVARDDVASALTTLRAEELPRTQPTGVLESVGKTGLIPSQAAEHAQIVAGIAGDLERTLHSIDGVLKARVHLNVPERDPLAKNAAEARSSASVLLEHRGSTPPLTSDAVQRLIAGGAAGLAPSDVSVVMLSRAGAPIAPTSQLSHVGPLVVARGSARALQSALGVLILLVAALSTFTLVLWSRLSRLKGQEPQKS